MNRHFVLIGILIFSNLAIAGPTKPLKQSAEVKRKVATDGDDCTLNFSSMSALVDAKSSKVRAYFGIAKDEVGKIQMEAALLANGNQLTVTSGGCAHLGQAFNYSIAEIKTDAQAVEAAIKNLEATPTTDNGNVVKNTWLNALKRWQNKQTHSNNKVINLSNGDPTLTLKYDVKDLLRIEYDFAL